MVELIYGSKRIHAERANTVLEVLAAIPEISIAAPCGGKQRCGKCIVSIPHDAPPATAADRRFLSQAQIDAGFRLACACSAHSIDTVVIPERDGRAFFKTALPRFDHPASPWRRAGEAGRYAVAVDIGTTTVAAYLVDTVDGAVVAVTAEMNRQAIYGADVLSRITYADAQEDGLGHLTRAIRAQVAAMITEAPRDTIGLVVVTGNTTMLHLFAGVSPHGIGRAPFVPAFTETREVTEAEFTRTVPTFRGAAGPFILLPSNAAYVGADIVGAAVSADMDRDEGTTLLVDIGTNGELALSHAGTVYTCATAAGPAFEGASIAAGVGGIAGAVATWRREGTTFHFETIDGAPPVGICGSGILDYLAVLRADGVVDETGRILDLSGDDTGGITDEEARRAWSAQATITDEAASFTIVDEYRFTQRDVREIQLAKAAIAAGIDVLCAEAGITTAAIRRVVLTGGFGNHLDVESAVAIGLLPRLPTDRYVTVDNAAGHGAVEVIRRETILERIQALASRARYVELSGHPRFQERYVEHMIFPEVTV